MKKGCFAAVLALLMMICIPGMAESFRFEEFGVALEGDASWRTLTEENASACGDWLEAMGADTQIALASMQQADEICRIWVEQGWQVGLSVTEAPRELWGEDSFAHAGDGQALLKGWLEARYPDADCQLADFSSYYVVVTDKQPAQAVDMTSVTLYTLHEDMLYALRVDGYDQEQVQPQLEALRSVADRLLFLGPEVAQAQHAYPELELPDTSTQSAKVSYTADATPLTLDDIPALIYEKSLTVTGTTTPDTGMRYYINSIGYDRFTSDSEGRFTIVIDDLSKGKQRIRVQAIGDAGYGTANFSVTVKQVKTPVAVSAVSDETDGDVYLLLGRTVPGAELTLYLRKQATPVQVAQDGSFQLEIPLPELGKYTYTLRATCENYLKNDTVIKLKKVKPGAAENAASTGMPSGAQSPTDELLTAPAAETTLRLSGMVEGMFNPDGTPYIVVRPDGCETRLAVQLPSLRTYTVGAAAELYCTLTGGTVAMESFGTLPLSVAWQAVVE